MSTVESFPHLSPVELRRRALDTESDATTIVGRILGRIKLSLGPPAPLQCSRPPIASSPSHDYRGRLLGRGWLARAETFTAEDLQWFRSFKGGR